MSNKKLPIEVSVKGVAAYSWLYKRDTKFAKKGEDGKFKLSIVFDKDDMDDLVAGIEGGSEKISGTEWVARALRAHADAGGDNANAPIKDGDKPVDKKGKAKEVNEEFAGKMMANFTTTYQPVFVDTKKNKLSADVKIMSGDLVKVVFRPNAFDEGVNFYMNAIMLLEKNASGGGADAFGDDEEGYTNDATAVDAFGDDDAGSVADGDY